jgi:RES domain-containing protein
LFRRQTIHNPIGQPDSSRKAIRRARAGAENEYSWCSDHLRARIILPESAPSEFVENLCQREWHPS